MSDQNKVFTTSCRIRAVDFDQLWLKDRARELCLDITPRSNGLNSASLAPNRMHRKVWEFAAICQVFRDNFIENRTNSHSFVPGCLGFGCGKEPIPAWLSANGAVVHATDAPHDNVNWTETSQRAQNLEDLPWQGICSASDRDGIRFSQIDMNLIPGDILQDQYDFTWSCGSFEHIGGIDQSISFLVEQMKALKPGGIAAHTTEFNPYDTDETLNEPNLCLFRERDLIRLRDAIESQKDELWALDLMPGDRAEDQIVDVPPYIGDIHLSIKVGQWTTTSILLVAQRGNH